MSKSAPVPSGKFRSRSRLVLLGLGWALLAALNSAQAQSQPQAQPAETTGGRQLQAIDVQPLPGQRLELRLRMNEAAPKPMSFTIDQPARIALDLPDTSLALPSRRKDVNMGPLTTVLAAEANGRTRIVLNMTSMVPYQTRVEGDSVYIDLGQGAGSGGATFAAAQTPSAAGGETPAPAEASSTGSEIQNIDFRRGPGGSGEVVVTLSDPHTSVNVQQQGGRVLVDFQGTKLPEKLMRRLDVTDFATPVATVDAMRSDGGSRLVVTPSGDFEQLAYQTDNLFTLELKPKQTQAQAAAQTSAGIFDENKKYTGQRLTLNFQDIETRAVLQLLADTSGQNIVVSDSVKGNVTLRLQNVPWDQALDIVLATKGLAMRRNGNVILVAPAEEIAAREQAQLKADKAKQDLEPLRSAFIQVNYAKAADLAKLIKGATSSGSAASSAGSTPGSTAAPSTSLLSDRGSIAIDERTNTLLVHDTDSNIENIRRLVATLDVPVKQVLIQARIVIVNDDYTRNLGVRMGATVVQQRHNNGLVSLTGTGSGSDTLVSSASLPSTTSPLPVSLPPIDQRYNVNLPVSNPAGSLALAVLDSNYLVDLELTAMQAEGKGRVESTPRVITANQREAQIKQGVEIPYQQSASSGATTTQFKDAVLSLTVTPQITPDDRIIMDLAVTKDSLGQTLPSATGGNVPSIDTRSIQTQVLVDDGGTVVLGGIYETQDTTNTHKVPVLGNIPGLGYLFRQRERINNNDELLIFVTPKILRDTATQ